MLHGTMRHLSRSMASKRGIDCRRIANVASLFPFTIVFPRFFSMGKRHSRGKSSEKALSIASFTLPLVLKLLTE
jgi:hypothetical protein